MIPNLFLLSASVLVSAGAVYVLMRAAWIPYEMKTDRLWKCGDAEPDEPDGEEMPETSAGEVIDLRSRKAS